MATISESFVQQLKDILSAETTDTEIKLRPESSATGELVLKLDTIKASDQVKECKGWKVLLIDEETFDYMGRITLDFANHESDSVGLGTWAELACAES